MDVALAESPFTLDEQRHVRATCESKRKKYANIAALELIQLRHRAHATGTQYGPRISSTGSLSKKDIQEERAIAHFIAAMEAQEKEKEREKDRARYLQPAIHPYDVLDLQRGGAPQPTDDQDEDGVYDDAH
jgi:hypothetical protein